MQSWCRTWPPNGSSRIRAKQKLHRKHREACKSSWSQIGSVSKFSDAPLRSGNRPKPQHWKSDESTEVEETSAEEDQDWNDDSDADWTVDSEGRSFAFWKKRVRTGGV